MDASKMPQLNSTTVPGNFPPEYAIGTYILPTISPRSASLSTSPAWESLTRRHRTSPRPHIELPSG